MKGKIRLTVNGESHLLGPGDVYPVPTGDVHVFVGVGNALILELSMPSLPKDNKFQEPCAAEWLKRNLYLPALRPIFSHHVHATIGCIDVRDVG
ncbi:MAG TPA: hypothetical protein ENH84_01385, partial [Phycisphaerae bacterium]|nr:hypothetical protein [Phycisphaerae bacterium]